jgi:hypothetical protein
MKNQQMRPVAGDKGTPICVRIHDERGNAVTTADEVTVRVKKPSGTLAGTHIMTPSELSDFPAAEGWWYFMPSGLYFDVVGTWTLRAKVIDGAAEWQDAMWRPLVVYAGE